MECHALLSAERRCGAGKCQTVCDHSGDLFGSLRGAWRPDGDSRMDPVGGPAAGSGILSDGDLLRGWIGPVDLSICKTMTPCRCGNLQRHKIL